MPLTKTPPKLEPAPFAAVTCPRIGKPPFRFNGHRLSHYHTDVVQISLWQRARGGYTVAFQVWAPSHGWRDDARNADTITLAMDLLEDICAEQSALLQNAPVTTGDLLGQLEECVRRKQIAQAYRAGVGEALEQWEALTVSEAVVGSARSRTTQNRSSEAL